ncbi:(deoxy)nucleoside triphosphate pyrophosphohydrolase [Eggerthellaceae bacterium zg-1084]|uniref:(deoxy)nucleoside triphosphate pyrophosphohydrolase n=1 Tax=Berryella wangjianweii TaxID=2734634 RepID=UPI001551E4B1|nr:(deoxy)nucleoside triphosphate pyrophosphohydrolase [Berryella wangjianweii]NPD31394.1 (deoxy)nucleoside triphosphate pyrophosphohydrolase [Berryella wangjianweii]
MSRHLNVVAAIIERDGSVLATQRATGSLAGGWEFPGGKVEPGEEPREALLREIREELDAQVSIERHVADIDHAYDDFTLHLRCYLCHLEGDGAYTLMEHADARWLDARSIDSVPWLPADIALIRRIKREGIVR